MTEVILEDGARIHCLVDDHLWPWEDRVPVFMVHGFGRNARFWDPWVAEVAKRRPVYRPDVRGCGGSSVPPEDYAFDAYALVDDLVQVLDGLGLPKVHWVGEHSGSLMGMVVALEHPERIASLVLVDSPTHIPDEIHHGVYPLGEETTSAALAKFGVAGWCARTIDYRLDTAHADPRLVEWYIAQMGRTPVHVASGLTNCFHGVNIADRVGGIAAPALLLSGGASGWVMEQQKALAETLPRGRIRIWPEYGHGVNLLDPTGCVAESVAFWDAVDD
jgi:pimeloyl-ACP methyl ester carboxylesterase